MNKPDFISDVLFSWAGDIAVIRSHLRGRQQSVSFERGDEPNVVLAVSRVILNVVRNGQLDESVAARLAQAARELPAIHFRISANNVEAYCVLRASQCLLRPPNPPQLNETARRLVIYLAHSADRLEFELARGEDVS